MSDVDVINWLACGERGISSNTIVEHLTGLNALGFRPGSHPWDPDDLSRCIKLLEACPNLAERFDDMRDVSPVWAGLVDAWSELVATFDDEAPGWRERRCGSAPKTYARMRKLIADAKRTESPRA